MHIKKIALKIVIPLLILSISFFIPIFKNFFDFSNIFSVVSLLFVIILGFFIAAATSNYLNFQACLAKEDSALISLHNYVGIVDPASKQEIANLIDHYLIETLDYKIGDYIYYTQKEYDEIVRAVDQIKINQKNPESSAVFSSMHEVKQDLLAVRQDIFQAGRSIVHTLHWIVLILLVSTMEFLLLSIRDGSFLINLVAGIVTIIMYLTLILLYEIDNNVFLEEQLAYEDPQSVFRALGNLPYYPETAIHHHLIKPPVRYRIGRYKNFPTSLEKTIEIVE